jgi:RHS repeat-associated protein
LVLEGIRSRCSGEQYDPDLGLYYLRARYYNPATGRFLSRDPLDGKAIDPKTLHKYLYAGGDPINKIDPTGKGIVEDAFQRTEGVIIDTFANEILGEEIDKILLCQAFDLLMEEGPPDVEFPWWYCEVGSL